jgi:hypothetical protein
MTWHLAQVNVARLRAPIDHPDTAEFVAALEPVNALADGSPGFVWRLQTDDGDATAIRVFDDEMIIVNLSVWASIEHLRAFVYRSAHTDVLRRRREWFDVMDEAHLAMWWIEAGAIPTVPEAVARLELLRGLGPTAEAFTFRQAFATPGEAPDRAEPASTLPR